MTTEDRQDYERECFERTRQALQAYEPDMCSARSCLTSTSRATIPTHLIAVSLTRADGEESTIEFPIWSFKRADGSPDLPENVAMINGTNTYEPP